MLSYEIKETFPLYIYKIRKEGVVYAICRRRR